MIPGLDNQNQPRAIVQLNGEKLPWTSIEVVNKNYYIADSYHITVPLYADNNFNFEFWGNLTSGDIQIYMGYPPILEFYSTEDLNLLFSGGVDVVNIDPVAGSVTLTGRDYSYLLIDKKISNTFINETASDLATKFAIENGLTPIVTKTTTPVGNYNNGYTQISNSITEWDLLTFFAQQNNFNLYVFNKELHFEPKPTSSTTPYEISYEFASTFDRTPTSTAEHITFGRTLTLAQDVEVKVKTFSMITGKSVVETARSHHIKGSLQDKKQTYVYNFPMLTPLQAAAKAQAILASITQHEILLNATLPPDFTLTKVTPLQVKNTNSVFDQLYYIDVLTRSLDATEGFKMTIEAKNHDTNSEVIT